MPPGPDWLGAHNDLYVLLLRRRHFSASSLRTHVRHRITFCSKDIRESLYFCFCCYCCIVVDKHLTHLQFMNITTTTTDTVTPITRDNNESKRRKHKTTINLKKGALQGDQRQASVMLSLCATRWPMLCIAVVIPVSNYRLSTSVHTSHHYHLQACWCICVCVGYKMLSFEWFEGLKSNEMHSEHFYFLFSALQLLLCNRTAHYASADARALHFSSLCCYCSCYIFCQPFQA